MSLEQCPECGVGPGQQHTNRCDVARCLSCGALHVECYYYRYRNDAGEGVGPRLCSVTDEPLPDRMQVWTGLYPGEAECREWGWWTYEIDPGLCACGGSGRVGVVEDLGRLDMAAACGAVGWDRKCERFVKVAP